MIARLRFLALIAGVLVFAAACSAEPTPLPVTLPTDTPAPTIEGGSDDPGVLIPFDLRVSLAPNMQGAVPAADLAGMRAAAQVDQLSVQVDPAAVVGSSADLYITYGTAPNALVSETRYRIAVAINPSLAPLDDPAVTALVREMLHPSLISGALSIAGIEAAPNPTPAPELAGLRGRLANAGYPDGFDLSLGVVDAFGVDGLRTHLLGLSIDAISAPLATDAALAGYANDELHIVLFGYTLDADRAVWVERAGAENVIDLFSLPISYLAAQGINVSFTVGGYPVPGS